MNRITVSSPQQSKIIAFPSECWYENVFRDTQNSKGSIHHIGVIQVGGEPTRLSDPEDESIV
jgi:hypothetical protein